MPFEYVMKKHDNGRISEETGNSAATPPSSESPSNGAWLTDSFRRVL